ncbi:MAG: 50S ribosomal protein L9 [Acidobacteriota bacterium]
MEVILVEDVEKLGRKGDVIKVAEGYGRNFLVPKKLAIQVTPSNLKQIEDAKKKIAKRLSKELEDARKQAALLSELMPVFERKISEKGQLYGSVTTQEIADFIKSKGFDIDKKRIRLDEPIRQLGEHPVQIKLHPEVTAEVRVSVVQAEEGGA